MKYFLLAICVCCLPQLGHAAGKIRPVGVSAGPSGNTTAPYYAPQKPSYRYGLAPTPEACNRSCWCGSPEVGAEALLWRNAISDFGYAKSSIGGIGTLLRDHPTYDWGVRAYVGYHFPSCWGARASYSYFDSRFSSTRTGDANPPVLSPVFTTVFSGALSFAGATVSERFQTADLEVMSTLCSPCFVTFRAFGGARWIEFRVREQYNYTPVVGVPFGAFQRSAFQGAGPRFGVGSTLCPIPCGFLEGFALEGQLAISAIIGTRSNLFQGTTNFFFTGDNGVRHSGETVILPGVDTRLGISYTLCWCGYSWTGYIDYELQYYRDAEERLSSTFGFGFPSSVFRAAAFSGINFGLRSKF